MGALLKVGRASQAHVEVMHGLVPRVPVKAMSNMSRVVKEACLQAAGLGVVPHEGMPCEEFLELKPCLAGQQLDLLFEWLKWGLEVPGTVRPLSPALLEGWLRSRQDKLEAETRLEEALLRTWQQAKLLLAPVYAAGDSPHWVLLAVRKGSQHEGQVEIRYYDSLSQPCIFCRSSAEAQCELLQLKAVVPARRNLARQPAGSGSCGHYVAHSGYLLARVEGPHHGQRLQT